jgi:hypothetical protein
MTDEVLIPVARIEKSIYLIRGHKVMLDRDLAALYEVETRVLNQAVTRNIRRFPDDFMFELTLCCGFGGRGLDSDGAYFDGLLAVGAV